MPVIFFFFVVNNLIREDRIKKEWGGNVQVMINGIVEVSVLVIIYP